MMKSISFSFGLVLLFLVNAAHGQTTAVTFSVDMNNETVSADGVHIAGGFQGWDPGSTLLTDANSDGIYEVTLDLPVESTYEFKFINGNAWGNDEIIPQACQSNGNRAVATGNGDSEVIYHVCWGSCAACGMTTVRFRVDMSNEEVSPFGVHVAGNFQGWDPASSLMNDADGDGVWEYIASFNGDSLPEGMLVFKFINGNNWSDQTEYLPNTACADDFGNRILELLELNMVLQGNEFTNSAPCFNACASCIPPTLVTFRVDMTTQETVSENGVHIAGSFQGWDPSANLLSDDDGDGIWETTVEMEAGETQFKFINGNEWGGEGEGNVDNENVIGVCAEGGNRFLNVGEEPIVYEACYNQCEMTCDGLYTVVDVITDSEDHTLLEFALGEAGLVNALNGDGPFTVFAPTDAAVNALLVDLQITAEELLALPNLGDILQYHVVAANAYSTDISDGQMIETLNGENITVSISGEGVFINNAQMTVADIAVDNGVVHVIDAVLLPPTPITTVIDVIIDSEDHTLLEAAMGAAGLIDALSSEGPFTVFAPTDDAVIQLVEALDITFEDFLALPNLGDILQYHVVAGAAYSFDLSDGQIIETLLGEDVIVSITVDGLFINDAEVVVEDITVDNGMVHVIDMVLSPNPGCMDVNAANFDPSASSDDGSCIYDFFGCTDSSACNYDVSATQYDGSCTYPGCQDSEASNYDPSAGCAGDCLYLAYDCSSIGDDAWTAEGIGLFPNWQQAMHGVDWAGEWVLNIPATIVEPGSGVVYGIHHMDWSGLEGLPDWVESASYELGELDASSQHCIVASGTPIAPGLHELTATGEVFISIFGQPFSIGEQSFSGWLEVAENPNPILGCTYANAVNFLNYANDDDGSCLFAGCTDSTAANFNPIATIDDGSCGEACDLAGDSTCQADNDGDGVITVSDLLILLGEFGATCE